YSPPPRAAAPPARRPPPRRRRQRGGCLCCTDLPPPGGSCHWGKSLSWSGGGRQWGCSPFLIAGGWWRIPPRCARRCRPPRGSPAVTLGSLEVSGLWHSCPLLLSLTILRQQIAAPAEGSHGSVHGPRRGAGRSGCRARHPLSQLC